MSDFDKFKIREYSFWDLYLHKEQYPYIGRCYAWARREDAKNLFDMNFQESSELLAIIHDWGDALRFLFGNRAWPNLAILGNTTPHLHVHLIPRHKESIELYGIKFEDPNPSGNYAPYPKMDLPLETLMRIKSDIEQIFP